MNEQERADKLRRAFVKLAGVKANVPKPPNIVVMMAQVAVYHDALNHLEALGFDVEEFKIKAHQIDSGTSGEKYVDRYLFLTLLDAALLYFEVQQRLFEGDPAAQQEPWLTVSGFKGPRKGE